RLLYSEPLFHTASTEGEIGALILYILLAVIVGLYTVYFAKISTVVKTWFAKIQNPYHKDWFGGISLGLLILVFPARYGEGCLTIQQMLYGQFGALVGNSPFSDYRSMAWFVVCDTVLTLSAKSLAS